MSVRRNAYVIHGGVGTIALKDGCTTATSGMILADGKKRCNRCGGLYPGTTEFFYRDKRKKDGLNNACKECEKERKQEFYKAHPDATHKDYLRKKAKYGSAWLNEQNRKQYYKDPEKTRKYARDKYRRYCSDPETKAKIQKQRKEYYQANIEEYRKWRSNYYSKNRENILKQKRDKYNGNR